MRCMSCMQEYDDRLTACPVCGYSSETGRLMAERFPDALPAGTILQGRYQAGVLQSCGDYENVYIAWDTLLEKRVVIREYFPFSAGRRKPGELTICARSGRNGVIFDEGMKAFEKEAFLLRKNQDISGMVPVLKVFRENGTAYQVEEFRKAYTAERLLDENKFLRYRDILLFMDGLCGAADALHARGIIHANIAPENMFLDDSFRPVLFDFGMRKAVFTVLEGRKAGIFNEEFSAPEVLHGKACLIASDIYSMGMVLRAMLSKLYPADRKYEKALRDTARAATETRPDRRITSAGEFSAMMHSDS